MEDKTPFPELFVLGAGPGDPELITVKGYKILQQANVILYDNLANKALLDIAKADCEKIYVGKHPYGSVVRLKGGDPFIFGRGFEEIMYAREQGIKTHYIPGISSMQASGFLDIPLTHRAMSEGVWIITGTKKDGTLSADLKLAMQSNATVVIYMGMKQIDSITETYVSEGRGQTPAAIIQHASLPHQKAVKGLVKDLPEMAAAHQLTYPAIIIIGEVAGLSA
jgi:uroporphyrin-III C-methyltransferase